MIFLNEDRLDISILSADKVLKNQSAREEFLTADVSVYQKTDGVKLTVIKKDNNGNINDYIFAYKGTVLYPEEYGYIPDYQVKRSSIGTSQFGLVFKHFEKLGKNKIPVNTELAIEFLMKKPTLSSQYTRLHQMVLIGYSKVSSFEDNFGKLKSNPGTFQTEKRTTYAAELGIDSPVRLFKGVLGSPSTFESGIKHKALKDEYAKRKKIMNFTDPELLIADIADMFLAIDSKYGGKEEGVVISYNDKLIKFQQAYQLDQNARRLIKAQFQDSDENVEKEYWKNVQRVAQDLALRVSSNKIHIALEELKNLVKNINLDFCHSKRCNVNIKDDIQLSAKTLILKQMKGNNGCLILGKFRLLTKNGHVKLVKDALKEFDSVVICLVTSKDTANTKDLRMKMLQAQFGSNPKVHIIEARTGNLITILNKSPININAVYTGSDRVDSYAKQLQRTQGVSVRELKRSDSDISATEIISKLDDEAFFKKNVTPEIFKFRDELLKTYL